MIYCNRLIIPCSLVVMVIIVHHFHVPEINIRLGIAGNDIRWSVYIIPCNLAVTVIVVYHFHVFVINKFPKNKKNENF